MLLFASSIKMIQYCHLFYFNLSEVVSHLDQKRTLHEINCVVFFAKTFIRSLNTA